MPIPPEDRFAIYELLSLHGHLMDNGDLDLLDTLFTADISYDLTDFGFDVLSGFAAIRESTLMLGAGNPVAHHVTNIILEEIGPDTVRARSKGIGIGVDGKTGSVVYEDVILRTGDGWRISFRKVLARRVPIGGKSAEAD